MADLSASVDYLQTLSHVRTDRIGVTGFCFGGGLTWLLSVRNSEIAAAVPFYRSAPPLDEVPNLSAPVLGIYAGDDERINSGVPDLESALQQNGKTYRVITYPETRHAFFNDTGNATARRPQPPPGRRLSGGSTSIQVVDVRPSCNY